MRALIIFVIISTTSLLGAEQKYKEHIGAIYETVKIMDPKLWDVVKQWDEYYKAQEKERSTKKPTFFYFFTLGNKDGDANTYLEKFNDAAAKLKEKNPQMRFYGVLRGMPKDQERMKKVFLGEVSRGKSVKGGVKVRFFPTLFEDLNITRAPAYAYALCEEDFGSDRGCDFYYLAKGGIGMDGFVEMMSEKDNFFKGWLNELNSAN